MEHGELITGRYKLVERLGRGGMGEVWAARDHTLHRDVALKLLDLDGSVHPDLPRRFEREAVAAAQINHPNVVALYDRGTHQDLLFLVMEKVDGATLSDHIQAETPMPVARALELASGICSALVAAHQANVIHYDIKPHNVMLTPDGQVKVVDFGIAGFIQTAFTLARTSELAPAGTAEYGAPEQFLTDRGDERSDLYALGSVLFALLTGRPPFTGRPAMAIVRQKLDEDAPRLDSLRPELPPALSGLIAELLDRAPARRPASARQVHERLRHIWASVDATVRSPVPDFATRPAEPEQIVAPPGPTRRRPEDPSPVEVSWTGKEPLSTYDRRLANLDWAGHAALAAISALVALVCLPLASGLRLKVLPGEDISPGLLPLLGGVLGVILAANSAITAIYRVHTFNSGRLLENKNREGWTLHVGPHYIAATSDTTGRCEFTWDQVERVRFEGITSRGKYVYTGVCIRTTDRADGPLCPAGWPYPWPEGQVTKRADKLFPICVLGPMPKKQRAALIEALASYGGQKWQPPAPRRLSAYVRGSA